MFDVKVNWRVCQASSYVLTQVNSVAPYVRIRSDPTELFNNKLQSIVDKKSNW